MKQKPKITRREHYGVRLKPEAKEKIHDLAKRLGVQRGELIETAIDRLDHDNGKSKIKAVRAARACIAEADDVLKLLERGSV